MGDEGKIEAFLPSCEVRSARSLQGRPGLSRQVVHDSAVRYEGFDHGSSYLDEILNDANRCPG
ncbi:MAG: hypothetical protein ACYCZM_12435 [Acidimicrobiales bacterium]